MKGKIEGIGYRVSIEHLGYKNRTRLPKVHTLYTINQKADFAKELMVRWGLITGVADGEDSAGRHKLRAELPVELIERACTTAELAFEEFKKRGWVLDLPVPEEVQPEPKSE